MGYTATTEDHSKVKKTRTKKSDLFKRTLHMLGHPVVKVELTEEHMKNALSLSESTFALYTFGETNERLSTIKRTWTDNYAMALMAETLVFIRSKYSDIPKVGRSVSINAEALLEFVMNEKHRLFKLLLEASGR